MPIFADNPPAGKCACQFVKSGDEVVLDYACAVHEKWRDGAVEGERAAITKRIREIHGEPFTMAAVLCVIEARALAPGK